MARGYSKHVVDAISSAPGDKLGVKLGRACVCNDISVEVVAEMIGLARGTVYSWFRGVTDVPRKHEDKVLELLQKLQ